MNKPDDGSGLPPAVRQKLEEIRSEDRRVRLRTGLLRALAVLLTAMLAAMAVDWLAVLHDERLRWTLTLLALACAAAALIRGCLLPLLRSRSLTSIAWQVDSQHPSSEERFLTLAGLAESGDARELRGSDAMLEKVAQQAAAMSGGISASSVIPRTGLVRAGKYLCGVSLALLLLFVVNFQQTKILFQRFWAPGADITLTRLQASPGDIVIGKGDDVNLEFTATGKPTDSADLFIRDTSQNEVIPLQRTAPTEAKFLYALNSVADSFDYRLRSGDGETAWHRVTVMDRPKISQVKLRIVPPAYTKLPAVEQEALPRQVRALEGSQLEVSFQSDQPLAGMALKFSNGKTLAIAESADHSYHFAATLTNTFAFQPVFTNLNHLDNLAKPTCQVEVYPDQPPTVTVKTPENAITARRDDKVKIDFEARDDFGVAKAEMVVTIKGDTNGSSSVVVPIPLNQDEAGAKLVRKQVELDLAKFDLKQDQELSYVITVTDTKENPAQSSPDQQAGDSQSKSDPSAKSEKSPAAQPQNSQKHLAANRAPSKPGADKPDQDSEGSKPPPNNMPRRVLDAGQCSSCQPMKIIVDEWGRSFEGQQREKLEIAIDPVLQLLDGLLGKAQQLTEATLAAARSTEGLGQKQSPAMETARDDLRQADSAVSDLKKVCQDTPYAFISLQIGDIRDAHISPARKNLGSVAFETATLKADITNLEQGSFQIKCARERLAELTKTYESVKRDNKLADALQRLTKMHQIFLEDTQAMLGSKQPILNPQDRKVAEVSDEYTEKLRKLLEEKKKIMAELSKILADDPRLLRRFLALEELDGRTLRDQMTLLAERQQSLAKQSAQWTGSTDKDRPAFLNEQIVAQSAEQNEVAEQTSKLLENIVTWAPMDVPVDKEPIAGCRKIAAEAARLASEAAKQTTPETINAGLASASNALEQLRDLQAALPGLDWIVQSKEKVSVFEANRMNDTADLITRQSGWIKKIQALRAGDYAQAAEVDQHRLMLDTTTLGEKLDGAAISVASLSAEIKAKADELTGTMHRQILPEESGATEALTRKTVPEAAGHQAGATNAFARGEKQFDELLHLIIAKLDAEPPPTEVGEAQSLDQILAMLEDEKKAVEKLGVPCRPINVQIAKDWMNPGSCNNPGGASPSAVKAQAQQAMLNAEKARGRAQLLVQQQVESLPQPEHAGPKIGPQAAVRGWNTLVSQLGDELRQGRDTVPPEQYRQAIEQYFSTIAEKPAEPAAAPAAAAH
jgi:hypothetical protein